MYHDAIQFKEEAISLFNLGYFSLQERAKAEQLYWVCCQKIYEITQHQDYVPNDLEDLEKIMAAIYYTNLSIFRSAPDAWAIDQLFPIMPIHRLDEEPTQRGILVDLTCDSDGKIDRFIDLENTKPVLELHSLQTLEEIDSKPLLLSDSLTSAMKGKQPYYLGMFLVGAYQEIMGNFHNLFGDINTVHLVMSADGNYIEHCVKGDTITDVLDYVQYNADKLLDTMRQRTEQALHNAQISLEESEKLLQNYQKNLDSYTYLTSLELK